MAKKMVSRRSSRAVGNNSGFFDTINSKFSSDKNYIYEKCINYSAAFFNNQSSFWIAGKGLLL